MKEKKTIAIQPDIGYNWLKQTIVCLILLGKR